MIKVVIFDFDGTLYSDLDLRSWKEYSIELCKHFKKIYGGKGFDKLVDTINNGNITNKEILQDLQALGVHKKEVSSYLDSYPTSNSIFEGCKTTSMQTLTLFAENFSLYVVSNAPQKTILANMKILGIDHRIFKEVGSNEGTDSKALLYQKIIKHENIFPEEMLVIGDTYNSDILPALELGGNGRVVKHADFQFNDYFDEQLNLRESKYTQLNNKT